MEHSTKVTSEIVGKGLSDLADVINNYMFQGKAYNKGKASELYGGWKLLTNPWFYLYTQIDQLFNEG